MFGYIIINLSSTICLFPTFSIQSSAVMNICTQISLHQCEGGILKNKSQM